MYGHKISRAEKRIEELEAEVQQLRGDVRRGRPHRSIAEDVVVPLAWLSACGLVGLGIAKVAGRLKKTA